MQKHMFQNVGYKIKDFFTEHMSNIQLIGIIGTIFGIGIQLFFLIKLDAVQFFSWSQTLNDFIIMFRYFIIMFGLFYLIYKIFKGKFIYKYVILILILILLAAHFFGKINHYIDSYFVIFFSIITFFLFFGEVISLLKEVFLSIKTKSFKRINFIVQLVSLLVLIGLYGYMYEFFISNVDNTFFNIYRVNFQYKGEFYQSLYFNDKYIFTENKNPTPNQGRVLIFPISMVDHFSK